MIALPKASSLVVTVERYFTPEWRRWLQSFVASADGRLQPTPVQTSDYTSVVDDLVNADPSGGGFTVALPARAKSGDRVRYKNTTTSTNAVTFEPASGDTVDEQSSVSNSTSRGSELFVFDATRRNWSRL